MRRTSGSLSLRENCHWPNESRSVWCHQLSNERDRIWSILAKRVVACDARCVLRHPNGFIRPKIAQGSDVHAAEIAMNRQGFISVAEQSVMTRLRRPARCVGTALDRQAKWKRSFSTVLVEVVRPLDDVRRGRVNWIGARTHR